MKFPSDPGIIDFVKSEICPNGLEYRRLRENQVLVKVKPEDLERLAEAFITKFGARLIHATAVDMDLADFEVLHIYDFSKVRDRLVLILKALVDRESPRIPSIGKITWQACWAEREMKELLGILPAGLPDPRHQFLPYEWPDPVEGASDSLPDLKTEVQGKDEYISLSLPIKEAYQSLIPIGPYHPGVIEGQVVYLKVEGENVVAADIKTGFHHRGIMKLVERRGYNRGAFLAERICGICSGAHGLAYVTCAENLYEAEVPERAMYIRTLLAELNRMQSHLLWIGVVADVIGWKTGFMLTWGLREGVLDILEAITGNRVNYGVWRLGGVSRDVPQDLAGRARRAVLNLKEECESLLSLVADHPVVKSRLLGVGKLTYEQAFNGGAVGPVARGSNWKIDTRANNPPHAMYDPRVISWEVIIDGGCDSYARTMVRVKELMVSAEIVEQCLDFLSKTSGEIRVKTKLIPRGEEGVGLNEAPRGELAYYIRASDNDSNLPHTVRIRTPSIRNNALLPLMLVGCNLADVPVIMGSLDQCLACTDRVEVVNEKNRASKSLSWEELVRLSRGANTRGE
ncbi:MAG: hydrogenase large subunit [Candidatus Methanomethylicaceae archaeon]